MTKRFERLADALTALGIALISIAVILTIAKLAFGQHRPPDVRVGDVHRVLIELPRCYHEHQPIELETLGERSARLWSVAEAITEQANRRRNGREPRWVATAIIRVWWEETKLAKYVGEGCLAPPEGAGRCDPDKDGVPQSLSYGQLKDSACPGLRVLKPGSEAELLKAAECTDRRFQGGLAQCRGRHPAGDIAGAFAGYYSEGISACRDMAHVSFTARAARFTSTLAKLWQPCAGSESCR